MLARSSRLASTTLRPRGARALGGGPTTPGGFVQDGPPSGGYPTVDVRRSLPGGGMSSLAAVSTIAGMFTFGMYKIIMANRERRCAHSERTATRVRPAQRARGRRQLFFLTILPPFCRV